MTHSYQGWINCLWVNSVSHKISQYNHYRSNCSEHNQGPPDGMTLNRTEEVRVNESESNRSENILTTIGTWWSWWWTWMNWWRRTLFRAVRAWRWPWMRGRTWWRGCFLYEWIMSHAGWVIHDGESCIIMSSTFLHAYGYTEMTNNDE